MPGDCRALVGARIREQGPMTVAAFMDLALYHPECGYYARAPRRSGRAGDFVTSVDVGPLYGELLAVQIAEMRQILASRRGSARPTASEPFDLVEAGASDGRLARDVLDWAASHDRAFYDSCRLYLVEQSAAARAAQRDTLKAHAPKLAASTANLPTTVRGVIVANELLDALPTHLVTMTADGLREVVVDVDGDTLVTRTALPSTPELASYLARVGVTLEPGWRAEINLQAIGWMRNAARALAEGFLILVDYGHPAERLYSAARAGGTLTACSGHTSVGPEADPKRPGWLDDPGERDLTSHVDLTSISMAAESEGLTLIAAMDQMYFLLGLADAIDEASGTSAAGIGRRLALKRLLLPGGPGSTHKVLIFGRGVGCPSLRCQSRGARLT